MLNKIIIFFVLLIGLCFIYMFPIKWLWNWLMPMLFGLPKITAWQALGLSLLCNLLLGSQTSKKEL